MKHVRFYRIGFGIFALGLAFGAVASTLITGAVVYDGSGGPGQRVAVRVDQDRIVAVGDLQPLAGEKVVDAKGRALAPGFIDSHSHHERGAFYERGMAPLLAQGVTTIVVGQDGRSAGSLAEVEAKFNAQPAAVNQTSYTGHGWLRDRVMGKDYKRTATPAEVAAHDAVLVATDHDAFDYAMLAAHARLIVDTRGVYRAPAANVVPA